MWFWLFRRVRPGRNYLEFSVSIRQHAYTERKTEGAPPLPPRDWVVWAYMTWHVPSSRSRFPRFLLGRPLLPFSVFFHLIFSPFPFLCTFSFYFLSLNRIRCATKAVVGGRTNQYFILTFRVFWTLRAHAFKNREVTAALLVEDLRVANAFHVVLKAFFFFKLISLFSFTQNTVRTKKVEVYQGQFKKKKEKVGAPCISHGRLYWHFSTPQSATVGTGSWKQLKRNYKFFIYPVINHDSNMSICLDFEWGRNKRTYGNDLTLPFNSALTVFQKKNQILKYGTT